MSQEPMVTLQGKVPSAIKNRIRLVLNEKGMNESEFVRKLAEDFLNGGTKPANQSGIQSQIDQLTAQVAELRECLFQALEVILINVTDNFEESSAVLNAVKTGKR